MLCVISKNSFTKVISVLLLRYCCNTVTNCDYCDSILDLWVGLPRKAQINSLNHLSAVHCAWWRHQCRVSSMCIARRGEIVQSELQSLSHSWHRRWQGQKHQENCGGDCDHVGIFVISFLQYGSFFCDWPASTVVDLVQESPRCLWRWW